MDQSNPHIWRFSLRDLLAIIFLMSINLLVVVSEDVECINTPPGVRQMIRGVDITQLDLIPLQFKSDNGFKSPVIKFTCNEKRMYTAGSARYHLPDQVRSPPGSNIVRILALFIQGRKPCIMSQLRRHNSLRAFKTTPRLHKCVILLTT